MAYSNKIIIVEDSKTIVKQIKLMLTHVNATVLNVGGGFGLHKEIDSYGHTADLILLDVNLKHESGLDILKELREAEPYKNIPVIIITESRLKDNVIQAKKYKANSYLTKPFTKQMLLDKIASCTGLDIHE